MSEFEHELRIKLDHPTLIQFYKTMAKAHRNWSGGSPYEQEILKGMRDELWKTIMEAQFKG